MEIYKIMFFFVLAKSSIINKIMVPGIFLVKQLVFKGSKSHWQQSINYVDDVETHKLLSFSNY